MRVANHKRARGAAARVRRFICWVLDVAAATNDAAANPDGKMVGVFDLRDVAFDCLDAGAMKQIFELLQVGRRERRGGTRANNHSFRSPPFLPPRPTSRNVWPA